MRPRLDPLAPLVLVLLAYVGGCAPSLDEPRPTSGDAQVLDILTRVADDAGIVGMAAVRVRAGADRPRAATVGWSQAGYSRPARIHDLWPIGRCTRPMTATLAARLVEEGALDWGTTLADVFPEERQRLGATGGATIEQLLAHEAGLPPEAGVGLPSRVRDPAAQRRGLVRRAGREAVATPGERVIESDYGYVLAGAMIERVTGRPFHEAFRAMLLVPLGMQKIEFAGNHDMSRGNVVRPHRPDGRLVYVRIPFLSDPAWSRPARSARALPGIWARLVQDHLDGPGGDSDYLEAETYRRLHRPRGGGFALGWAVVDRTGDPLDTEAGPGPAPDAPDAPAAPDGAPWLQCDGTGSVSSCLVRFSPARGAGVLVCANQGEMGEALDAAADRILALPPD